jgi:putative membrane protein
LENPIVGGDSSRRLSGVSLALSATGVASYNKITASECAGYRKVAEMSAVFAQLVTSSLLPEHFWGSLISSAAFGLLGIVLLLLGYLLFDLITPRIDVQKELTEKNVAVALVIAALLLGIAYIAAHVVQ